MVVRSATSASKPAKRRPPAGSAASKRLPLLAAGQISDPPPRTPRPSPPDRRRCRAPPVGPSVRNLGVCPPGGGPEAPPPHQATHPLLACGCPRSAASPTPCGSPRHGRESPPGPAGCGRGVPHRCTGPQGRAYGAWGVHERGPPLAAVARRPWSAPSPKEFTRGGEKNRLGSLPL